MTDLTYYQVCSEDDLPDGDRLFIEMDEDPVVIFHHHGEYFAIADLCTHDNGPLGEGELEDHQVVCPRHGARFDITTGEVLTLPAVKSVKSYPVRVVDGVIEIGVEE